MRSDHWLFVFKTEPCEGGLVADGLDLCLVAAAFGIDLKILFVGNGVSHIVKPEKNALFVDALPKYAKTFKALADFEIEECFVFDQSLEELKVGVDGLSIDAGIVDANEMRSLINSSSQVFNF